MIWGRGLSNRRRIYYQIYDNIYYLIIIIYLYYYISFWVHFKTIFSFYSSLLERIDMGYSLFFQRTPQEMAYKKTDQKRKVIFFGRLHHTLDMLQMPMHRAHFIVSKAISLNLLYISFPDKSTISGIFVIIRQAAGVFLVCLIKQDNAKNGRIYIYYGEATIREGLTCSGFAERIRRRPAISDRSIRTSCLFLGEATGSWTGSHLYAKIAEAMIFTTCMRPSDCSGF